MDMLGLKQGSDMFASVEKGIEVNDIFVTDL